MKGKLQALASLMWIILVLVPVVQADTLRVPADFPTIATALHAATAGDEVLVKPGTYLVNNLVMPSGVSLVGAGTRPNYTILRGEDKGRILLCEGVDSNTLIRNLTFTRGRAFGTSSYDCSGGAILISNGSPRVEDCIFVENQADTHGGAIRCNHASPTLSNCLFLENSAQQGGGGLDCSYDSSPTITDCMFKSNTAAWGGAISCRDNAAPLVVRTGFDVNEASGDFGFGGAIFADYQATPSFDGCTFYRNQGEYGGAIACFEESQTNLFQCTLVDNSARVMGAGVLSNQSAPVIRNSIIAFHDGTGVTSAGDRIPAITCSNLYGNTAGNWVSDISIENRATSNISADPLFCHPGPGLDFRLPLDQASPCAPENNSCEQIGAWPVGCEQLPQALSSFTAQWEDGIPHLEWWIPVTGGDFTFKLARTNSDNPGFEVLIPYQDLGNGHYLALDEELSLEKSLEYTYLVFLVPADGQDILVGEQTLANAPIVKPLRLVGAWPNPFNPLTTIHFDLGKAQRIQVSVFDMSGRRIRLLADEVFGRGEHAMVWNGQDDSGRTVGSGTYFLMLQGETDTFTSKVTMLK